MIKKLLRRLRGILGTGLTWAVGWAGVTVALSLIGGVPFPFLFRVVLSGAAQGFIAGGVFATILSVAERRHTLEDLSLRRVALWGGIGGACLFVPIYPMLMSAGIPLFRLALPLAINALMGAGFASGSVALARRADHRLIDGEDDPILSLPGDDLP